MPPPPPAVVESFGVRGVPQPLAGGRGLCYVVDQVVFKPYAAEDEAQRMSELVEKLARRTSKHYIVPTPLSLAHDRNIFVSDGWTASRYAHGRASTGRLEEKIKICRALHSDLAPMARQRSDAIENRPNRWNLADKITWGEAKIEETAGVDKSILAQLHPLLNYLAQVWTPLPTGVQY